jgi:hypothetical protein
MNENDAAIVGLQSTSLGEEIVGRIALLGAISETP